LWCVSGSGGAEVEYKPLPGGQSNGIQKDTKEEEVIKNTLVSCYD
jgi:hypothetical protein